MKSRLLLLCTVVMMILLQGCGSTPVDNLPVFIAQQRSMAQADQGRGELASALDHWQVLLLAAPDDVQARQQIIDLEAELEKRAQAAYSKGLGALSAGRLKRAKKYFIETLAARPNDSAALAQLREIKSVQMNKYQHARPGKTTQGVGADKGRAYEQDASKQAPLHVDERLRSHVRRIKAYLAASQLFQADAQYQHAVQRSSEDLVAREQLAGLSNALADSYFQHARRLMRSDLNKAIEYLQISLRYKTDDEAQMLLQRSRLILENLTKIQGSGASKKNN